MKSEQKEKQFQELRPLLFSIAYRMLGTASEAEDMIQETFLRWHQTDLAKVKSAKAFLATTITRICINYLESARVQREQYVGPWLPEPIATADVAPELADSLSFAFLTLLETLSPPERAVFLLRNVFDFDFKEISKVLGKNEPACRQIFSRARKNLSPLKKRFQAEKSKVIQLMTRFGETVLTGDLNGLVSMLADDVTLYSDGGGKVTAALNPIYGLDRVSRFFLGIAPKLPAYTSQAAEINGNPAIVNFLDGEVDNIVAVDIENDKIRNIYIISNPDKLRQIRQSIKK